MLDYVSRMKNTSDKVTLLFPETYLEIKPALEVQENSTAESCFPLIEITSLPNARTFSICSTENVVIEM